MSRLINIILHSMYFIQLQQNTDLAQTDPILMSFILTHSGSLLGQLTCQEKVVFSEIVQVSEVKVGCSYIRSARNKLYIFPERIVLVVSSVFHLAKAFVFF